MYKFIPIGRIFTEPNTNENRDIIILVIITRFINSNCTHLVTNHQGILASPSACIGKKITLTLKKIKMENTMECKLLHLIPLNSGIQ